MRMQSLSGSTCCSSTVVHGLSQPSSACSHRIGQLAHKRPFLQQGRLVPVAAASTDAPASASVEAAAAAAATTTAASAALAAACSQHDPAVCHQRPRHQESPTGAQRQQQQPLSSKQQQQQQKQQQLVDKRQRHQQQHVQSKLGPRELQQLYTQQPKVFTAHIKASSSWQQLQQLLNAAGQTANHIHLAAAVVHCVQLQLQQQQQSPNHSSMGRSCSSNSSSSNKWIVGLSQQLLNQHCIELELRHTSNLLWALAVSHSSSSSSSSSSSVVSGSSSSSSSSESNSGGLSDSSSSSEVPPSLIATLLQVQLQQLQQQQQQWTSRQQPRTAIQFIKAQDLSNSIWALGSLKHNPPRPWLDVVLPFCQQLLPQMSLQELSNTAWGLARLGEKLPHEFVQGYLAECLSRFQQQLQAIDSGAGQQQQQQRQNRGCNTTAAAAAAVAPTQALANIAHSLASLQCVPGQRWLAEFYCTSQLLLQHFTPQQLSMTIWAAAKWSSLTGGVSAPASWIMAFAAAVQQQQQERFSDQAIVNIAASSYQLLLHIQALDTETLDTDTAAVVQMQEIQTAIQQLQRVVGFVLHAAAGRLQALPVSAAAALAWAATGISKHWTPMRGTFHAPQQQQQQQQQHEWLKQYVAVHTGTAPQAPMQQQQQYSNSQLTPIPDIATTNTAAAAAAAAAVQSFCHEQVQLLWLCAKAAQLPSSAHWCCSACSVLLQQLSVLPAGQFAQLVWSVAKLLEACCNQQQQQQNGHAGDTVVPRTADQESLQQQQQQASSAVSITASLTKLATALVHVAPDQLQAMHSKQLVETVASLASMSNSLICLQQQQQQLQQQTAGLVQHLALHMSQCSCELTYQQQQLVMHSVHQLLLHCPHAAASSAELQQALSCMLECTMQQQQAHSSNSAMETVCLAIHLLAVAQYPAHATAAAATARATRLLQDAPEADGSAPAAAAPPPPAAAAAVHSNCRVLPCVLLPLSQGCQQQLLSGLHSLTELDAKQLLRTAQLSARLRVVLPGSIVHGLLYALQGHIAANSYSPRLLLQVLLVLRHWRAVPRSAAAVRTSLINSWLVATQQCMCEEVRQHLQRRAQQQQKQQEQPEQLPQMNEQHHAVPTAAAQPRMRAAAEYNQIDGDYVSMMLTGLARLRVHPNEQWMQLYIKVLIQLLPQISPDHLSKVLISLANLGYKPQEPAAQLLLQRSGQMLPGMTAAQLVRTMHALSKLQLQPSDEWMQQFYAAVEANADSLHMSGFGMVVWALAKAGAKPEQGWMEQLLQHTFSASESIIKNSSSSSSGGMATLARLKPQHLANILCAFAKLGFTPGPEWMVWFRVQLGQQAGALQEIDHFHIEWAWRELNEQQHTVVSRTSAHAS